MADWIRAQMARDPDLAQAVAEEELNARIAQQVYEFRKKAELTQKELADRIGTQQSVISRIEDDDYDGHSLTLLRRIALALGLKLSVEFHEEAHSTTDVQDLARAAPAVSDTTEVIAPTTVPAHASQSVWVVIGGFGPKQAWGR